MSHFTSEAQVTTTSVLSFHLAYFILAGKQDKGGCAIGPSIPSNPADQQLNESDLVSLLNCREHQFKWNQRYVERVEMHHLSTYCTNLMKSNCGDGTAGLFTSILLSIKGVGKMSRPRAFCFPSIVISEKLLLFIDTRR